MCDQDSKPADTRSLNIRSKPLGKTGSIPARYLAHTHHHPVKYQILLKARQRDFFKINILCYTLYPFMLKYLSICPVTACAGIYSNLFHFAVCSVLIFTGKSPFDCMYYERIHSYLFDLTVCFCITILHQNAIQVWAFFFFKALHA